MMRYPLQRALSVAALSLAATAWAADPNPAGLPRPDTASSYVAAGPTGEMDLARLRAALEKLPGLAQLNVRPSPVGAAVIVRGETGVSLLAAAARKVGFELRPAPTRFFSASGPATDEDLARLREALKKLDGVDELAVGRDGGVAAVRVTGIAASADLAAVGRAAGFQMRQLGSFVAAGSSGEAELSRLRQALKDVPGVEQVELRGLKGGATVLIYGDVRDRPLAAAAKGAGYALWSLAGVAAPREFRVESKTGTADPKRLREALAGLQGLGEVEVRSGANGVRLFVTGGGGRPEPLMAAAAAAEFRLTPVESVSLPTLNPEAGRNTPPDYGERVLEEQAVPGQPAPDFNLLQMDGAKTLRLSDFRGKKPVVLLFGSCT